ncbi:hypothetical protein ONZ45_g9746 [Pleurotus djamor]|nr:hypothetical protein ONZ45_g9746 [Pleurotus djamor]
MPNPTTLTISQGKRREDTLSTLPQTADSPQSPTTGDKRKRLNGSQKRKKKKERDANRDPSNPSSSKTQIEVPSELDQDADMSDATVSTESTHMDEDAPGPGEIKLRNAPRRRTTPHPEQSLAPAPQPAQGTPAQPADNQPQQGTQPPPAVLAQQDDEDDGTPPPVYRLFSVANPHHQTTRITPPPGYEVQSYIPYTMAQFPRLVKPQVALLGGILKDEQEKIKANPDDYLALIIFGAGDALRSEIPRLTPLVETFVKSLCDPTMMHPKVADPPKQFPNASSEWGKPHILLCWDMEAELRDYLLWFQTFAFQLNGHKIAFSALSLDESIHSWYVCDFSSTYIDGNPNTRAKVKQCIIATLRDDPQFRNIVDTCVGTLDPRFANLDERLDATFQTFTLYDVEISEDVHIIQLFAEPIANNGQMHSEWIRIITSQRYIIDLTELQVQTKAKKNRLYDSCTFCKDDTHDVARCPFPHIKDWKGPTPAEVAAARSPLWSNPQGPLTRGGRARGRGSTRGRGRGPSRGHSRGRSSPSRGRGRGFN